MDYNEEIYNFLNLSKEKYKNKNSNNKINIKPSINIKSQKYQNDVKSKVITLEETIEKLSSCC